MKKDVTPTKAGKGTSKRKIHGIAVRFYKRTEGGNLTMDFEVMGERVQESTGWPLMVDAERVADMRVRKLKELKQGLTAAEAKNHKARGPVATVKDVLDLLAKPEGKLWKPATLRTYTSALVRLAAVVSPARPKEARLDAVLTSSTIDTFYAQEQGLPIPDWTSDLPVNGGCNATVRNVKAMFSTKSVKRKLHELKLPDLKDLREAVYLHDPVEGFIPWPDDIYDAMHEASEVLRAEKPELWLVNAMLRRLGLRDEELLSARREWIEAKIEPAGDDMGPPHLRGAWLVIKNRGSEFTLLKHGAARRLEMDEELASILLVRVGYLVANGWSDSTRSDLIYRLHSKWLRPLLPEGEHAKTNHQLRMYAGSKIYTEHGLESAAYFLGHKSTATTERYYAAWLGTAPVLNAAAVAMSGAPVRRKAA